MPFTIVRPFNWIGPRMDYIPGVDGPSDGIPRVLACFSTCLMSGKPMQLVDGGKNQRTFVYVKDAVEVMYKIMDMPEKSVGRIFNVGNPDNEVTIKELADMMADVSFLLPALFAAVIAIFFILCFIIKLCEYTVALPLCRSTPR